MSLAPAGGGWGGPNAMALDMPTVVVRVTQSMLRPFCHNELQHAALVLPDRAIEFGRGAITFDQMQMHRPSYMKAVLIQRTGAAQGPAPIAVRPSPACLPFLF